MRVGVAVGADPLDLAGSRRHAHVLGAAQREHDGAEPRARLERPPTRAHRGIDGREDVGRGLERDGAQPLVDVERRRVAQESAQVHAALSVLLRRRAHEHVVHLDVRRLADDPEDRRRDVAPASRTFSRSFSFAGASGDPENTSANSVST